MKEIHDIGVFHLDIKPENIILCNGCYKLCDFGSAIDSAVEFDRLDKREKNSFMEYI